MTNIWAQPFEEIRKPFFDTESLEEERAKKDYDGDGKVESGAKEYRGVVHNAIQKKKGGKPDGKDTSSVKEDVEQIDEISQKTATRAYAASSTGEFEGQDSPRDVQRTDNLRKHIKRKFGDKAARHADRAAHSMTFGRKGMPSVKEAVETLTEVDRTQEAQKRLDVRKGIHNKVVINPEVGKDVKEEVEAWIGELVEEGYDLSQFTLNEMVDIYESADLEEGTAGMPARGDAETVDATNDRMLSAKRRAAQAQIRADLARVQLQKTSMARESFDSIVEYLSQRPNVFENLDEGMTLADYKKKRSAVKRSEKRAAEKLSPTRRKGIHNPEKAPERAARRDAAYGETGHGGALRAKKVRKAKALGELG